MRTANKFLAALALAALVTAGCAGPEQKFGRGLNNTFEIVRLGELQRSVEQSSIFDSPSVGYTYGVVHGINRTLERTGLGIYEMVTFPIPSYDPILTSYIPAKAPEPDNFRAGLPDDPLFETDTFTGFSGGMEAPFIPGSKFAVFDY